MHEEDDYIRQALGLSRDSSRDSSRETSSPGRLWDPGSSFPLIITQAEFEALSPLARERLEQLRQIPPYIRLDKERVFQALEGNAPVYLGKSLSLLEDGTIVIKRMFELFIDQAETLRLEAAQTGGHMSLIVRRLLDEAGYCDEEERKKRKDN